MSEVYQVPEAVQGLPPTARDDINMTDRLIAHFEAPKLAIERRPDHRGEQPPTLFLTRSGNALI